MSVKLIVYLIGCVVYIFLHLNDVYRKKGQITISELITSFIISIFSWVGIVAFILCMYGNVVILKKKNKDEST